MKITKQEIIDMNACKDGLARFLEQTNDTDAPVDVASIVGGVNTLEDLMWLAERKLPRERVVRLACDCALTCVELIKPYTERYDELVQFLKEPTAGDTASDIASATASVVVHVAGEANVGRASDSDLAAARATDAATAAAVAADTLAASVYAGAVHAAVVHAVVASANACKRYDVGHIMEKVHQLLIDMFNEVES